MKSIVKKISAALLIVPALMLSFAFAGGIATSVSAAPNCDDPATAGLSPECAKVDQQPANLFGNGGMITTIINILLFVIGILVIMIIYGGIRYVISRGKDDEVKNAKNTILYAIVGLIIAILAYAVVNFVVGSLGVGN